MTQSPVQQPPAQTQVLVKAPSNGMATTGLVLGIIGAVFAVIPLVGAFGAFLGGLGLVFAVVGLVQAGKRGVGKGKSIAGIVLGIASIAIFLVVTAATVAAVDSVATDIEKDIAAQTDTSAASDTSDKGEIGDAKVGAVKEDMFSLTAKVTVTNSSDNPSDYMATVVFESPDGKKQYGTGALFIESLRPGQTKAENVVMLDEKPKNAGKVVARLTDFDRMLSN